MNAQKKTLAIVLGGTFAASLAMSPVVNADQNPFAVNALTKAYQVADAKDGKCGTGKCGADKKKAMEEKAKEGSCSADKAKEGSCSADKAKEATCSADKKAKEGSCKH
ncbi:MAG: hypothetical protein ACKVN9_11080 [Methylophilaceae bacterium]